ncbi:hypothetical protein [Lacticaseibacillus daqingensis]|uniref:hypothetical protein n=1 Tax=Lacticaseibacillus daqingensis TaxID=2486014 RepID=UPI000F7A7222|nr:hypothetical protein [Lacticaseibacillus daqingensis]
MQQNTRDLGRQIIDQLVILAVLLGAWFFRDDLSQLWAKALIFVIILALGVDYFIHSPKIAAKLRNRK